MPTRASQHGSIVQIPILNPLFAPLRSMDVEESEIFLKAPPTWNTATIEEVNAQSPKEQYSTLELLLDQAIVLVRLP